MAIATPPSSNLTDMITLDLQFIDQGRVVAPTLIQHYAPPIPHQKLFPRVLFHPHI